MDKKTFLNMCNRAIVYNKFAPNDAVTIVYDYCIEKGKSSQLTDMFIRQSISRNLIPQLVNIAADYFSDKYTVTYVQTQILDPLTGYRKIIKVF